MPFDANAAESSAAEDTVVVAPASAVADAGTDANATGSSAVDEKDAKEPANLLDVVKAAVEPAGEATAAESSTAEGETGTEATTEEMATTAATDAEADASLPFHNHPRWKEVVAERDGLRTDAEQYRTITTFMQTHGLTGEEMAESYEVMALLKSGDPAQLSKAREFFQSRLQSLDGMLGNVLPDDLQDKVDAGEIDEDSAQEVARLRASDKLRTQQAEARETRDSEAETERTRVATAEAMVTAVEGWETRIKASNPDYAKIAELVEDQCRAIVQRTGNPPASPADAVALCDQALKDVNTRLKSLLPPKASVNPTPRSSSTPTVSEPKTLREAIAASISG